MNKERRIEIEGMSNDELTLKASSFTVNPEMESLSANPAKLAEQDVWKRLQHAHYLEAKHAFETLHRRQRQGS